MDYSEAASELPLVDSDLQLYSLVLPGAQEVCCGRSGFLLQRTCAAENH